MCYDITKWTTKEIKDLVIPLKAFYTSIRVDFHPREIRRDGKITIVFAGDEITGVVKNKTITVETIKISGEGSATVYNEILMPALKKSSGYLRAVIIWEGGDYIHELISDNGVITENKIEL